MRCSFPVVATLMLVATSAVAQDAGLVDAGTADAGAAVDAGTVTDGGGVTDAGDADAGTGCGAITFYGECDGAVLSYCDEGTLVIEDCAETTSAGGGLPLVCVEISTEFGFACAAQVGEQCADDEALYFCAGTDPACVDDGTTATCVENVGSFQDADIGTCDGEDLIYDVIETQAYVVRCSSVGGRCEDDGSLCVEAELGEACFADLIECDTGLECVDDACATAAGEGEGEGEGEADGGTGGEPDGGCGCAASSPSSRAPGAAAAALVAVLLGTSALRRRRRA